MSARSAPLPNATPWSERQNVTLNASLQPSRRSAQSKPKLALGPWPNKFSSALGPQIRPNTSQPQSYIPHPPQCPALTSSAQS